MRYLLTALALVAASTLTSNAQTVQPLLDGQNYVFMAQTSQPLSGSERRLTINSYFLKITKDKIVCNLPYSGNSQVASTDAMTSALDFTTAKFTYKATPMKNGWKVRIKPKNEAYLDELDLVIHPDGSATVEATFNGLDNISFAGMVADPSVLAAQ